MLISKGLIAGGVALLAVGGVAVTNPFTSDSSSVEEVSASDADIAVEALAATTNAPLEPNPDSSWGDPDSLEDYAALARVKAGGGRQMTIDDLGKGL